MRLVPEFRLPFDGTVGDHMSIVVNRVQREIVCFSSAPNRTTTNTVLSSFFATLTKLHFNRTHPDTEYLNVAGHRVYSLVPLTSPFRDQKVVLRVLLLTRTLSVDTLFGGSSSLTSLHVSSLLLEGSRHRLVSGNQLAKRGNGSTFSTQVT